MHHEPTAAQRKCALCGNPYPRCECLCTWCGSKLWTLTAAGNWHHHVCGNRSVAGAR